MQGYKECRFNHPEGNGSGGAKTNPGRRTEPQGKRVCRNWAKGGCSFGKGCAFEHDNVCHMWAREQKCTRNNCRFSHPPAPMGSATNSAATNPVGAATIPSVASINPLGLCYSFVNDAGCTTQPCPYSHDLPPSCSSIFKEDATLISDLTQDAILPYCMGRVAGMEMALRMDSCCVGLGGVISLEVANLIQQKGDPETTIRWGQNYVKQLRESLITRGVLTTRLVFTDREDDRKKASFLTHFTIIEGVDHSPIVGWGLIHNWVTMTPGSDHFGFPAGVKVTKLTRSVAALMERNWGPRLVRESAIPAVNAVTRMMGDLNNAEAIFGYSPTTFSRQ